jgi:hypothetical protein
MRREGGMRMGTSGGEEAHCVEISYLIYLPAFIARCVAAVYLSKVGGEKGRE